MKIILALSTALILSSTAHARLHKQVPVPTESFLVADVNGNIVSEQNGLVVRPIASITKLMTTLLASEQDMDEQLDIPSTRSVESSIPHRVKSLTRRELITLALVKSDNLAAQILCTNLPDCVDRMNMRAQDIGMVSTRYVEPTGLDSGNVSTAEDLLKLVMVAAGNPTLTELSSMTKVEIPINHGMIRVRNTNPLTATLDVVLSKTGFTRPAGGCMVMEVNTDAGKRIYILLGSRNVRTRVPEMKRLVAQL
jgi:serine-type D-Ala-D-Ala endopeptidase (penicillin-binding protein 7)